MHDVYALYEVWYDHLDHSKFKLHLIAIFETMPTLIKYVKKELKYKKIDISDDLISDDGDIIHFSTADNNTKISYSIKEISYYFDGDLD